MRGRTLGATEVRVLEDWLLVQVDDYDARLMLFAYYAEVASREAGCGYPDQRIVEAFTGALLRHGKWLVGYAPHLALVRLVFALTINDKAEEMELRKLWERVAASPTADNRALENAMQFHVLPGRDHALARRLLDRLSKCGFLDEHKAKFWRDLIASSRK